MVRLAKSVEFRALRLGGSGQQRTTTPKKKASDAYLVALHSAQITCLVVGLSDFLYHPYFLDADDFAAAFFGGMTFRDWKFVKHDFFSLKGKEEELYCFILLFFAISSDAKLLLYAINSVQRKEG